MTASISAGLFWHSRHPKAGRLSCLQDRASDLFAVWAAHAGQNLGEDPRCPAWSEGKDARNDVEGRKQVRGKTMFTPMSTGDPARQASRPSQAACERKPTQPYSLLAVPGAMPASCCAASLDLNTQLLANPESDASRKSPRKKVRLNGYWLPAAASSMMLLATALWTHKTLDTDVSLPPGLQNPRCSSWCPAWTETPSSGLAGGRRPLLCHPSRRRPDV